MNDLSFENGMKCNFYKNANLHSVTIGLYIKAGLMYEKNGVFGISHLLEHLFFRRLSDLEQKELYFLTESIGADLKGITYRDCICFSMTVASKYFKDAMVIFEKFFDLYEWTDEDIAKEKKVHIERLSKEDIELIKNEMKQNIMSEEELFDFIRRTQSEVLSQYEIKTGKPNELVKVGYSLDGRKIAWSNAIVFEIAHQSEFNDKGGYVDSKNEVSKYEFLENLILQMEQEFSEKLDLPVSVFLK